MTVLATVLAAVETAAHARCSAQANRATTGGGLTRLMPACVVDAQGSHRITRSNNMGNAKLPKICFLEEKIH